VVLVDANVLLYAVNDSMPQHPRARRWIEQALNGNESVGFAWFVLLAFVRLATLPRLEGELHTWSRSSTRRGH
jgi:uncharacterized protein